MSQAIRNARRVGTTLHYSATQPSNNMHEEEKLNLGFKLYPRRGSKLNMNHPVKIVQFERGRRRT
jgi:hypothetical protein